MAFWLGNAVVLLLLFAVGGAIGVGLGMLLEMDFAVWGGLGGALGLALLFGVGWPWVKLRSIRFALAYLTISGPLDLAQVQRTPRRPRPWATPSPASSTSASISGD